MPCDPQCQLRQLNSQLILIKEEKITTLRQTLDVHDELGCLSPHRREEVARNKRYVSHKLVEAVAELVCLTEEIARGCNPCQKD